jgi:hypothetical protein
MPTMETPSCDTQTDRVVYLPVTIIPDKGSKRETQAHGLVCHASLAAEALPRSPYGTRHVESVDSCCPPYPYRKDSMLRKHLRSVSNCNSRGVMDLRTSRREEPSRTDQGCGGS